MEERLFYNMFWRKIAVLRGFVACVIALGFHGVARASVCGSNNPAPAGQYCWASGTHPCESGCYCTGSSDVEYGGKLNSCNASQGTFKFGAISHSSSVAGVHVCPSGYPLSNESSDAASDCYQECSNGNRVHNKTLDCSGSYYLAPRFDGCSFCERGYKCPGINNVRPFCSGNPLGRVKCTGNQYSSENGATSCSVCDGDGMVVVVEGGLNVGCALCDGAGMGVNEDHTACAVCRDGMYANENHVCVSCPAGHYCTNGLDNGLCPAGKCASNGLFCVQSGASQCKNCANGTYSNANRTNCVACNTANVYHEDGECKTCPDIAYNTTLYNRIQIAENAGMEMCGLGLDFDASVCASGDVKWYVKNNAWKQMDNNRVAADMNSYIKAAEPTMPDEDWCAACPSGNFNVSGGMGEESCAACPAGYCTSGESCLPCQRGHYCPAGFGGNAQSCSATSDDGFGTVNSCGDGHHCSCPKGSFSDVAQAACSLCASGYTTAGAGTEYDEETSDINDICTKVIIKLKLSNGPVIDFPSALRQGSINNKSVR